MKQSENIDNRPQARSAVENPSIQHPPMRYNLRELLKCSPRAYQVYRLRAAKMNALQLNLQMEVIFGFDRGIRCFQLIDITCVNAVDYTIRPRDPRIIEGIPYIQHTENTGFLYNNIDRDAAPDSGKVVDPLPRVHRLGIDQSYVTAQRFEMIIQENPLFKATP